MASGIMIALWGDIKILVLPLLNEISDARARNGEKCDFQRSRFFDEKEE